jgi:hypothetical protein
MALADVITGFYLMLFAVKTEVMAINRLSARQSLASYS